MANKNENLSNDNINRMNEQGKKDFSKGAKEGERREGSEQEQQRRTGQNGGDVGQSRRT